MHHHRYSLARVIFRSMVVVNGELAANPGSFIDHGCGFPRPFLVWLEGIVDMAAFFLRLSRRPGLFQDTLNRNISRVNPINLAQLGHFDLFDQIWRQGWSLQV